MNNRAILQISLAELTETVLDILWYPDSSIRSTMDRPETFFNIKVLRRFKNAILRLAIANAVFHKRAML